MTGAPASCHSSRPSSGPGVELGLRENLPQYTLGFGGFAAHRIAQVFFQVTAQPDEVGFAGEMIAQFGFRGNYRNFRGPH